MKRLIIVVMALLVMGSDAGATEAMLMVRSQQAFPEAMMNLQDALRTRGYRIVRVQRVDVGLQKMGYQTDKYRVVFYAKASELKYLSEHYPQLIPFLPGKISIFAEDGETVLVSANPANLKEFFPEIKLGEQFDRWSEDVRGVFAEVSHAD